MKRLIIVINGKGGCGKDTLCNFASEKYFTLNVSSIDPMKKMAEIIGWNGSKTLEDRKFLADLKTLVTKYNDGANEYILKKAKEFADLPEYQIMFVHIREPEMIEHFKKTVKRRVCDIPVVTLLVSRNEKDYLVYGNIADDEVNNYKYDHVFENNDNLNNTKETFLKFLDSILTD
jgi:dephospho-CoA kinase